MPTELCSLLGNLVDNAIEATLKIRDTEKRRIFVKPIAKNGNFITWKTDKINHGIGLLSIKNIIDKYEGAIESNFKNHVFKSTIILHFYTV